MSRIIDEINAMVKQAQARVVRPPRSNEQINKVNRVRNFGQAGRNNAPGVYDSVPQEVLKDVAALNPNGAGSGATSAAEMADINDAVRRSNPRINMQLNNAPYKHGVRPDAVGYSQNRQVVPHNRVGGVQVVREQRESDGAAPKDTVQADPNNQWLAAERNDGSGQDWNSYSENWWNKRFKQREEEAKRRAEARKAQQAQQPVQQPAPQPAQQPAKRPAKRPAQRLAPRPAPRPAPQQQQGATPAPKAKLPSFRNISLPGAQAIGGALRKVPNVDASNSKIPAAGPTTPMPTTAAPAAKAAPAPQQPVKQPAPSAKPTVTPAAKSAPAPQEPAPVQDTAGTDATTQVGANSQQGNWGDWNNMIPQWPAFASMGNGGGFNPMGMMMFPMMMNSGMFNGMFGLGAGGSRVTPSPTDIASASSV